MKRKDTKTATTDRDENPTDDSSSLSVPDQVIPPIPSEPNQALVSSYSYTSPIPLDCLPGSSSSSSSSSPPCILGVDEAGRGPVLGPLVYGIAYCPISSTDELEQIGFTDSKALTAERRDFLFQSLTSSNSCVGWSVRVLSPQDISSGMLKKRPTNLNLQSLEATVCLISDVLSKKRINVTHIYVDTVGDPKTYTRTLKDQFRDYKHIEWTVTSKADAIYPIVGAASIAAKVTRDRCMENWKYAEAFSASPPPPPPPSKVEVGENVHKRKHSSDPIVTTTENTNKEIKDSIDWSVLKTGSGYPSDPNTVAFLKHTIDPVFGWPGIVRFSWATAQTMLLSSFSSSSSSSKKSSSTNRTFTKRTVSSKQSSSSSSSISEPSSTTMEEPNHRISLFGTRFPTKSNSYKVTWIDAPTVLSKWFSSKSSSVTVQTGSLVSHNHHLSIQILEQEVESSQLSKQVFKDLESKYPQIGKVTRDLGLQSCGAGWLDE